MQYHFVLYECFYFQLDPEESFNVSHNESVQIIDVVNASSKSSEATTSATPSGATLFPTPATSASESTEPSPWDDLKTKFRTEDVIKYFKENQSLKVLIVKLISFAAYSEFLIMLKCSFC